MEDVLDVYARPYDPCFPVICMDEASKQLVGEVRDQLPMRPGDPLRIDSEYVRLGTCNLFMFCEPLRGWRHVRVTERRTKVDWAHALRDFLNVFYAEAEKIVLVMDNLNTHSPGSFYEAFEPEEARRLTERLEIHYTPKHGSWLNIAECEFSVLQRQCLNRRIDKAAFLGHEVNAWQASRNATDSQINWQFTTCDARVKLRRLYPEYLRRDAAQPTPEPTPVHN
jgi:DDE superfamily endonuclease